MPGPTLDRFGQPLRTVRGNNYPILRHNAWQFEHGSEEQVTEATIEASDIIREVDSLRSLVTKLIRQPYYSGAEGPSIAVKVRDEWLEITEDEAQAIEKIHVLAMVVRSS